jgi:hypothetical protein
MFHDVLHVLHVELTPIKQTDRHVIDDPIAFYLSFPQPNLQPIYFLIIELQQR